MDWSKLILILKTFWTVNHVLCAYVLYGAQFCVGASVIFLDSLIWSRVAKLIDVWLASFGIYVKLVFLILLETKFTF